MEHKNKIDIEKKKTGSYLLREINKTQKLYVYNIMVKRYLFGMNSISMFEPYASELGQFYREDHMYNNKLFYAPFPDDIDIFKCSSNTEREH